MVPEKDVSGLAVAIYDPDRKGIFIHRNQLRASHFKVGDRFSVKWGKQDLFSLTILKVNQERCVYCRINATTPKAAVREDIMECKTEKNLKKCNCSYEPCVRKGNCCDCLSYHLASRELPACCFPNDAERTYDRSFEHFARLVAKNRV